MCSHNVDANIDSDMEESNLYFDFNDRVAKELGLRDEDTYQFRDVEDILTERSRRFYDPKVADDRKERCVVVGVDTKLSERRGLKEREISFSFDESLYELYELCGTAGLVVIGSCFQRMYKPNFSTYIGPGKVIELMSALNATGVRTVVFDDDLTTKQQRTLERTLAGMGGGDVKILDRTALILEIFAQHAKSREGQLQVELALCEYRLTRGPSPGLLADDRGNSGVGMRGPGETKLETDKRVIRDRIVSLKKQIQALAEKREHSRDSRKRLGLPIVALVGYTNAGKSTLLNKLSRAGVLAENLLFATLDPTTRRIRVPRSRKTVDGVNSEETEEDTKQKYNKGQEILLTDTVGFISKLPTDLIAAFRATLEEVSGADILIHVCDRSSPVWKKQRETVLRELDTIGCTSTPIVELWNKIDVLDNHDDVMVEALTLPIDVEIVEPINQEIEADNDESDNQRENKYDNCVWDGDEEYVRATALVNSDSARTDNLNMRKEDIAANRLGADVASKTRLYGKASYGPKQRKVFTVAASVKTGLGFDDFTATLEDALNLLLRKIHVFIPFSEDNGFVTMIHNQGYVYETDYTDKGSFISCRVPESLFNKLKPFEVATKEG